MPLKVIRMATKSIELRCTIGNAKGKVQKKTIAGQEYLVAPITLIVPGVLSGSQGAGFYSKTENGKNVRAWNGMPLLNGHPRPGEGSGRNADIMNERYLGFVLDVKNDKELTGKAYFSVTALNTVKGGAQIKRMLLNGEPIEVSTGLDLERLKQKGTHNGESYDWIAKNYQPDHVAVLLDEKGACSTEDGCGINNAEDAVTENNCGIGEDGFEQGNDCAKGSGGGTSDIKSLKSEVDRLAAVKTRGMSTARLREHAAELRAARARYTDSLKEETAASRERSAAMDREMDAIREGSARATGLKRQIATADRSTARIQRDMDEVDESGEADRILRERSRRTARNSVDEKCEECGEEECNCEAAETDTTNSISNEEETMSKKMTKAQRAEVINSIVENGCDCYTEEDVDALNTYTDERLKAIANHLEEHVTNKELVTNAGTDLGKVAARRLRNAMSDEEVEAEYKNRQAKKAAQNGDNPFAKKDPDAASEDEEMDDSMEEEDKEKVMMKKGTKNSAMTMNQWLESAPAEARSTLNRMFQRDKKEREGLLQTIVNHYVPDGDEDEAKGVYDVHNAMSIEHLEMLAARLKKDAVDNREEEHDARPSFAGRVPALNGRKSDAKKAGTPLGLPSIDDMFTVINGRKTSSFQN